MRAGGPSSTLTGKMYNTASNWTTFRYGWTADPVGDPDLLVGAWDGPEQQLQWWMSKRPMQTTVVETATPDAPTTKNFYSERGAPPDRVCTTPFDFKGRFGQVWFEQHPDCDGRLWIPEGVTIYPNGSWTWGDGPLGTYLKALMYRDPGTLQCDYLQIGSSQADNAAARQLLRSFLLPGGSDLTWSFKGPCAQTNIGDYANYDGTYKDNYFGAWKAFSSPAPRGGLGPNVVYSGNTYPAPAVGDPYYVDTGLDQNIPFSPQTVRFGWFDSQLGQSVTDDNWFPELANVGRNFWNYLSYCADNSELGWAVSDTCTMSVTPVQPDVLADPATQACGAALPQGLPFITCRWVWCCVVRCCGHSLARDV